MSVDPQNLLDASAQVLKAAPETYADLAKPTVQQTGAFLARIPHAINAALAPIDVWIAKREYSVEETKKLLALKLQNIDPGKIVPPEPYVAVPAIQAISYCMDSDELREMYANLLARSMDSDKKGNVHPAFVEIIKQMSPLDARLFTTICENPLRPLFTLSRKLADTEGEITLSRNITQFNIGSIGEIAKSIDNLLRCGLIEIPELTIYTNEQHYDAIRHNPAYIAVRTYFETHLLQPGEELKETKGVISITDIGQAFYAVCINNP